jgi:uncharacterized protein Usg
MKMCHSVSSAQFRILEVQECRKVRSRSRVVVEYHYTVGGINRINSNLTTYPVTKKVGKTYYQKKCHHLFDKMIWNSCVLYPENGGVKNYLQLWIELVELLIQKHCSEDGNSKPGCL